MATLYQHPSAQVRWAEPPVSRLSLVLALKDAMTERASIIAELGMDCPQHILQQQLYDQARLRGLMQRN